MTDQQLNMLRQCTRIVAVVALWFLLTLLAMMSVQYMQSQRALPETAKMLDSLKAGLPEQQENAVYKENIRQMDYVYRTTYFTHSYRMQLGTRMIIGALAVLVLTSGVSLVLNRYSPQMPQKRKVVTHDVRVFVLSVSGVLLAMGILSFLYLKQQGFFADEGATTIAPVKTEPPTQQGVAPTQEEPLPVPDELWAQFRGGYGHIDDLPGTDFKEAWRIKIPLHGYSSPIVAGNRIFVTGANRSTRSIFAYSVQDGSTLWRYDFPAAAKLPEVSDDTGYAASTPATDGRYVFAIFATGQLAAVDMNGKLVWQKNFTLPHINYGYANSLLLFDGKLIVQFDTENEHILYALNPADGKELWRNARTDHSASSWATPLGFQTSGGKSYIVTLSNELVECFDAETGNHAWKKNDLYGEIAASPAFADGRVLVLNSGLPAMAYQQETGEIIWKNQNVALPDVSSCAVLGEFIFYFNSNGNAGAISVVDGKHLYEEEFNGGFYSSPVALPKGWLIAGAMDGKLYLFRPDEKGLNKIHEFELNDPVFATPAVVRSGIVVRTTDYLVKLEASTP